MSTIYVNIAGIEGESGNVEYNGQIECVAMSHVIDLPLVSSAVRVEGSSRHAPVVLTHRLDKASPALKHAALAGSNLGDVTLTRMRTIAGRATPVETVTLRDAYIVRVDLETLLDEAAGELGDELLESFHLMYSEIRWSQQRYIGDVAAGAVEGGWSVATESLV